MKALRQPRRLTRGDRVAIVAPSGPFPASALARGMAVLRGWGLEPVAMPGAHDTHERLPFIAGTDAGRAADFESAWGDPGFAAVIAARGGSGSQRMIDLVDWAALAAAEPKAFVGFSDVTAVHAAIAARLGVASLHGPMPAWSTFIEDAATQEHLRLTLFEPERARQIDSPTARPLVPGRAAGITFGGCASLIAAGVGTGDDHTDAAGGLLLLEDIGEEDYRIDRILTQLRRSGRLDGVTGIVLGSWTDCSPYDTVRSVLYDRLGDLGVPVAEQFGFGHCSPSWTIPLGVPAVLDADAGTLAFDVPALM